MKIYPGDASGEAPPVPIPNTEVKLSSAEDTRGATSWENRSSPGYFISAPPARMAGGALGILEDVDRICPLLALGADRRTVIDGVDGSHRCHAVEPALPIDRQMQAQLCLGAAHERCERYRAYVARTGVTRPGRADVADGLVGTRLVLAPEPPWRGIAGRARRARSGTLLAVGAGAVAIGLAGVAAASVIDDGGIDFAALLGPTATPRPTVAPTPSPEPAVTPPPTSTPIPSASPAPTAAPTAETTPVPTANVTPAPTPPPPPQTYTVVEGDTLAAIAERFGTSVSALQAANDIGDPNEIVIGQVLVIP